MRPAVWWPPAVLVVLVVVVVVVVVPVTGLRLVAVCRLPPPSSLLLRLGCAVERVARVVRGAVVRWVREDVRGMLKIDKIGGELT